MTETLNVKDAAELLGVHVNTVRNWAREGVLTDVRVPGAAFLRLDRGEIERMVANRNQPYQPRTPQEETDMWWAGGLFVGEGSVFIQNRKRAGMLTQYLSISLLMTDERTVTRFRDIVTPYIQRARRKFKPNALNSYTPPGGRRPVYQFTVTGAPAEAVARALHPYIRNTDKEDQMIRHFKTLGLEAL